MRTVFLAQRREHDVLKFGRDRNDSASRPAITTNSSTNVANTSIQRL